MSAVSAENCACCRKRAASASVVGLSTTGGGGTGPVLGGGDGLPPPPPQADSDNAATSAIPAAPVPSLSIAAGSFDTGSTSASRSCKSPPFAVQGSPALLVRAIRRLVETNRPLPRLRR